MKFAALFFDFFGTLVDIFKVDAYFQNVREIASVLGVDPKKFNEQWMQVSLRRERIFSTVKERILDACESLGPLPGPDELAHAEKLRMNFFLSNTAPRPDAIPVLDWAKSVGYRLGLVTNCTIELPEIWLRHPLARFFPAPVFSSVEQIRKPNPEIYLRACNKNGVQPQDVIFIGDGDDHEMDGAEKVGMKTILVVDPDPRSIRRHPQPKMDPKVDKLSELPDLIAKIEKSGASKVK